MYRYCLFSLCLLLPLFSACDVSVSLSDESQQLYTIAMPNSDRDKKVKFRVRVLMPDGEPPKECYVWFNAHVHYYSDPIFPFVKRATGGSSGGGGGPYPQDGTPLELEAFVGSNVIVMAATSHRLQEGLTAYPTRKDKNEVYVAHPYAFAAEEENNEIVLRLEKGTLVNGKLRYDNGDSVFGREGVSVRQFISAARGADIPYVQNYSVAGTGAYIDDNGEFNFPLWTGEFALSTVGMPWVKPVTKTIRIEQGKPVETELTIPTPLRINVVMPDGSPAGNFRLCQLAVYRPVNQASRFMEVWSSSLYDARRWDDDPPFVVPEHPIALNLCRDENYVTVMTEDNEYGIVRKLEPELMGQELTLTLRPTIEGTVQLPNTVNQDVSILVRIMKLERNGDYTEKSEYFGPKLHFRTDAEGRVNFKVPVFEGVDDSVWLCFKRGESDWGNASGGSTNRSGSWFRHSKAEEQFKQFRPPADGKPFDLGVMEIER